jgi:hypothetical protein
VGFVHFYFKWNRLGGVRSTTELRPNSKTGVTVMPYESYINGPHYGSALSVVERAISKDRLARGASHPAASGKCEIETGKRTFSPSRREDCRGSEPLHRAGDSLGGEAVTHARDRLTGFQPYKISITMFALLELINGNTFALPCKSPIIIDFKSVMDFCNLACPVLKYNADEGRHDASQPAGTSRLDPDSQDPER